MEPYLIGIVPFFLPPPPKKKKKSGVIQWTLVITNSLEPSEISLFSLLYQNFVISGLPRMDYHPYFNLICFIESTVFSCTFSCHCSADDHYKYNQVVPTCCNALKHSKPDRQYGCPTLRFQTYSKFSPAKGMLTSLKEKLQSRFKSIQ